MVDETVEIIILAIVMTGIFGFCLGLCYMIYLTYCRRCCRQHSLENNYETTQAMFYVTEVAPEVSECDHEGRRSSIVFKTNDSNIN